MVRSGTRKSTDQLASTKSWEEIDTRNALAAQHKSEEAAKGTYLLLCTISDDQPNIFMVYDYPYAHTYSSIKEGLMSIKSDNISDPGMWPPGSWLFLYGLWFGGVIEKLHEALDVAAWPYR